MILWPDRGGGQGARDPDRAEAYYERLATAVRERGAEGTIDCWQGLRAIELLWEERSADFGGEDIVRGLFRDLVADCKQALQGLALSFSPGADPLPLPEPGEEQMESLRAFARRMRAVR